LHQSSQVDHNKSINRTEK